MENDHIEHVSNVVAHVGAAITGAAYVWHWMALNHDAITSACAIVGMLIAITGALINGYYRWFK